MIKVNNLTKIYRTPIKTNNFLQDLFARKYEEKKALNNISFEIGEDEFVGFVGPNGAGKTTTMKILSGILYPTSGNIEVLGFTPFEKRKEFLKQIGFVMGQKNQLLWELPAIDSFQLAKEIYEVNDITYKKTLNNLIELLDAQKLVEQPLKTLSLGQRMRMELIASLLHQPKILFLDEPTIGLDIFAQTTVRNFIKEYQRMYHATIILTSHYMQDVQKLTKRVILIDTGKIIFDGQLGDLKEEYSDEKTITITLERPEEKLPDLDFKYDYQAPLLKINLKKEKLNTILPEILKKIDFSDLTIEDEPIEEIIKNIFMRKKDSPS
ncbi:MAG: ATP-binding cassette domain-containing protein [Candidatus Roizmanbacteria bacterium]|nr:MAG: ATP-binding cassette domain-containing protein [Candidatus Roizmanbacteria bacterium]